jgi:murein L,D-transpeptidase YcbB/YkuD
LDFALKYCQDKVDLTIFIQLPFVFYSVKRFSLFILLAVVVGTACTSYKSQPVSSGRDSVISVSFDRGLIENVSLSTPAFIHTFYKDRHFTLAWSDSTGRTAVADSLIAFIRSAERYGLIPDDYHLSQIDHLVSLPLSHTSAVTLDLYLSDAFVSIWHHLKLGRLDAKTLTRMNLTASKEVQVVSRLHTAIENKSVRQELEKRFPADKQYPDLQHALQVSLAAHQTDSVSIKKRNKLIANLERLRWKGSRPSRYIRVNTPSFMLQVFEIDSLIVESKVIVGKPETPTPVLNSMVKSFIIYPYWHVPQSIVKEILPQIQEDTLYLRRHNYDVLNSAGNPVRVSSVDWKAYDANSFPFILRQREGSENTMGVIKFVFHNNYGVYLHDTNARGLFSKSGRALSHGCIRVHRAVALARYLIKDDYIVSPEDLDQYMQLQHRLEINFPKPIPIYLDYFTCESVNGAVRYYDDIYDKDELILRALRGEEPVVL